MSYEKDRAEFIRVMVEELRHQGIEWARATEIAKAILRDAQTIQRIAVNGCNRELSDGERKQESQAEARIEKVCEPLSITPTFGGDPRGTVVHLFLPSGKWNSWGGAECGYCVPARG